jgi:hypothetical protein
MVRGVRGQLIEGGKHRRLYINNNAERRFKQLDWLMPKPLEPYNDSLSVPTRRSHVSTGT